MAAPTQKGQSLVVGIGSFTYSGYYVGEVSLTPTATERKVLNEDGATATIIITDAGKQISMRNLVVHTGSDPEALAIGDTVTVNSVNYRITAVDPVRKKGEEMVVGFTAVKEVSMTYT